MTNTQRPFFDTHIFCCINERAAGHSRGCCHEKGAESLRNYLKDQTKKLDTSKTIRINASGCLDRCELGPVMVIYPEGVWYTYKTKDDIDEIIRSHIKNGKYVERLLLQNKKS